MLSIITEIRKYRSSKNLTMGTPLPPIAIKGKAEQKKLLEPFWEDLTFVARAKEILFQDKDDTTPADKPTIVI